MSEDRPLTGPDAVIFDHLMHLVAIGRHHGTWSQADIQRVSEAHLEHPHTLRRALNNERARANAAEEKVAELRARIRQLMATAQALPEQPTTERRVVYLTAKRNDVLNLMVTGASRRQIAAKLRISESSVADRTRRIVAAMGVNRRADAISLVLGRRVEVRVLDEERAA